jgi:hypothetical protein
VLARPALEMLSGLKNAIAEKAKASGASSGGGTKKWKTRGELAQEQASRESETKKRRTDEAAVEERERTPAVVQAAPVAKPVEEDQEVGLGLQLAQVCP